MSNADIITAHYAASDRGDLDGMLAPLADDVSWTEAAGFPYAGTYLGPDAVAAGVFQRIHDEWDTTRSPSTRSSTAETWSWASAPTRVRTERPADSSPPASRTSGA